MNTLFFNYLLPTSIAVALFYGSYYFLLRKGSFFQLNRFFLLFALLFSFVLPFIRFETSAPIQQINYTIITEQVANPAPVMTTVSLEKNFDWNAFLKTVYLIGIAFMFARLLPQFAHILFLVIRFGVKKENGYSVVRMKNNLPHFSFFRLIFINQNKLNAGEELSIIAHEAAHIKQCHFIDLLLLEVATAFQWFNPVMWLYKRSLKSIHEYLADQAVLKSGAEKVNYCQLLVKQTTGFHLESLTNSFYYPSLKNRIAMMTKKQNHRRNLLKLCFVLPVFALLIGVFACNESDIKKIPTSESAKVQWPDYTDNPYQPAVFKGGESEIANCFLSAIDFDDWNTIITDQTQIEINLGISELGKVEKVGVNYEKIFLRQSSKDDFDFYSHFKEMGDWKPATTKEGASIKSIYTFDGADILRAELKRRGLKIYTQKEADEYNKKFEKRVDKLRQYTTKPDQAAKYKNGDDDIAAYFLSKLDFSKWKSKITDNSIVQCSFCINESGAVDNVEFQFISQGSYTNEDFRIDLSKMGDWAPALKDGKPIKSLYIYDAGDALRKAMKEKGLKVYTVVEYIKAVIKSE